MILIKVMHLLISAEQPFNQSTCYVDRICIYEQIAK